MGSLEISHVISLLAVLVGASGVVLSLATVFLNLILKELKEIRSTMLDLVATTHNHEGRINSFDERFHGLRCNRCNERE